ncbi:hypothetical protein [Methylomonas koyamae]|nr:hypothetical protein [Methylomonas koyamae]
MDLWLPRMSHFAQFGLFLFTVFSLYFTVLPLYQKALLEEAIARKELELKEASALLNKKYEQIRSYAVSEYVVKASAKCSDLLIRPPELTTLETKETPETTDAKVVYDIDVANCLKSEFETTTSFKRELSHQDLTFFLEAITTIGVELAEIRATSFAQYKTVDDTISEDKILAQKKSSFTAQYLELMKSSFSPARQKEERRKAAIYLEKLRISHEYGESIRNRIFRLHQLTWPSE